jgi:hypothetical protein
VHPCERSSKSACDAGLFLVAADSLWNKAIANPGLSLNVLLSSFSFELLAKLSDEDPEILGLVCGLSPPDGCKEGTVGNHFAGMAREVEQEVELLGGKVNGFAKDSDGMGVGVDDKVACFEGGRGALGRAA